MTGDFFKLPPEQRRAIWAKLLARGQKKKAR